MSRVRSSVRTSEDSFFFIFVLLAGWAIVRHCSGTDKNRGLGQLFMTP